MFSKVGKEHTTAAMTIALAFGFIAMIVLTFILSIIVNVTDIDESKLSGSTYSIHAIAVLLGGWSGGKRIGSRGWFYGGLCGLLYSFIILLIAFLAYDASLNTYSFILIGIGAAAGMLGGIVGVNMRK